MNGSYQSLEARLARLEQIFSRIAPLPANTAPSQQQNACGCPSPSDDIVLIETEDEEEEIVEVQEGKEATTDGTEVAWRRYSWGRKDLSCSEHREKQVTIYSDGRFKDRSVIRNPQTAWYSITNISEGTKLKFSDGTEITNWSTYWGAFNPGERKTINRSGFKAEIRDNFKSIAKASRSRSCNCLPC